MVKILNTLRQRSPLGETISQLGQTMFGDQVGGDIKREELYAAQRGNTEMDNLLAMVGGAGAHTLGADPAAQAALIGSGYDPDAFGQIGRMGAATGYGARDPRTTDWIVTTGPYTESPEAFDLTLAETARNNDMDSADFRYNVDVDDATTRRGQDIDHEEWFTTPLPALDAELNPVYGNQGDLAGGGYQPILSQAERQGTMAPGILGNPDATPEELDYIGVEFPEETAGTPKNYYVNGETFITYDGVTDAQTGQRLPPGGQIMNTSLEGGAEEIGLTPANDTYVERSLINLGLLWQTNKSLLDVIDQAPDSIFGPAGRLVELGRGVVTGVANLIGLAGGEVSSETIRQSVADQIATQSQEQIARGEQPTLSASIMDVLFSPDASELQTLAGFQMFQAASALAGQDGRDVSDADVRRIQTLVGNPLGWTMDRARYREKIQVLQNITEDRYNYFRQVDGQEPIDFVGGATPLGGAPASNFDRSLITRENLQQTMLANGLLSQEQAIDALAAQFNVSREELLDALAANSGAL